jgi:hypothetical protein
MDKGLGAIDKRHIVPDPLLSLDEYCRFYHLDLCGLQDEELRDEFHALRPLLWGLPRNHWFRERVERLRNELKGRSRDREWGDKRKPKSGEGVVL